MADKKAGKPDKPGSPFEDSSELFESLFRDELDALTSDGPETKSPKLAKKLPPNQKPKPSSQPKRAKNRKVLPATETGEKKMAKKRPPSPPAAEGPGALSPKTQAKNGSTHSPSQRKAPAELTPRTGGKIHKIKIRGRRPGNPGRFSVGSDKLRMGLLAVLLLGLAAYFMDYFGVVDFGGLFGPAEKTQVAAIQPAKAKKPPAKGIKKSPPTAIKKAAQGGRTAGVADKAGARKGPRIVKRPPKATLSQQRPRIVKRPSRPTAQSQRPVVAQKRHQPSPSEKRPTVSPRTPSAGLTQRSSVAVPRPAKPAATPQRPPVVKPPASTPAPQGPVVASRSPQATLSRPKAPLTPKPTSSARKVTQKGPPPEAELFSEERLTSFPYSVYLGSYKTRRRAEKAMAIYRSRGLAPYWVKVNLGKKGVWYRVFTGYFKDKQEANHFIEKRQLAEGQAKRTRYAALVGVYDAKEALERKMAALSRIGYSPYAVVQPNGESLLFIGSFYTRAGAEKLHRELSSRGVQNRVVER